MPEWFEEEDEKGLVERLIEEMEKKPSESGEGEEPESTEESIVDEAVREARDLYLSTDMTQTEVAEEIVDKYGLPEDYVPKIKRALQGLGKLKKRQKAGRRYTVESEAALDTAVKRIFFERTAEEVTEEAKEIVAERYDIGKAVHEWLDSRGYDTDDPVALVIEALDFYAKWFGEVDLLRRKLALYKHLIDFLLPIATKEVSKLRVLEDMGLVLMLSALRGDMNDELLRIYERILEE